MTSKLIVKSSSIELHDYLPGDHPEIERALCYYDKAIFKVIEFALYYNEEDKILYIPRGLDISYIERVTKLNAEFNYDAAKTKKPTKIRLKSQPRNELQKKSISFLTAKGDFLGLANRSQFILNLSTGAGKTYCGVASVSLSNQIPMIMTPTENIKQQWIDAFEAYTDVVPSDILNIKSSEIIKKIMNGKVRLVYRAYIVNRQTLAQYAKRNGWNAVNDLFVKLGIGIKIFDEAHMTLQTNYMIDFFTNVFTTYYLTATFKRSSPDEDRIMQLSFKNVVSYGEISREVLKKHIVYTKVNFHSKPNYMDKIETKTRRGFDPMLYTKYLLGKDIFVDVLQELMDSIIKMNPDEKLRVMITSATVESTEEISHIIKTLYPDLRVGSYHFKMDTAEKLDNLENCNVLCTTPKSLGTGSNISGLRFLINTVPFKSKVTSDQLSGRLRYLDDKGTVFFNLIDRDFATIVKWSKNYEATLFSKTKKNIELNL